MTDFLWTCAEISHTAVLPAPHGSWWTSSSSQSASRPFPASAGLPLLLPGTPDPTGAATARSLAGKQLLIAQSSPGKEALKRTWAEEWEDLYSSPRSITPTLCPEGGGSTKASHLQRFLIPWSSSTGIYILQNICVKYFAEYFVSHLNGENTSLGCKASLDGYSEQDQDIGFLIFTEKPEPLFFGHCCWEPQAALHHFGWKHMAFEWDICSYSPAILTTKLGLWLEAFSTIWAIGINQKSPIFIPRANGNALGSFSGEIPVCLGRRVTCARLA